MKLSIMKQDKPKLDMECIGTGYIKNTPFIVWKLKFSQLIYLKDNTKGEKDGWYLIGESD